MGSSGAKKVATPAEVRVQRRGCPNIVDQSRSWHSCPGRFYPESLGTAVADVSGQTHDVTNDAP
eukprot:2806471-Pyramimonas_sp.AAC.1